MAQLAYIIMDIALHVVRSGPEFVVLQRPHQGVSIPEGEVGLGAIRKQSPEDTTLLRGP